MKEPQLLNNRVNQTDRRSIYSRCYRSSFRRLMGWDLRVATTCIRRGVQLLQLRSADGCRRRQLPKGMMTTTSAGGCSSPWGSAECRWTAQRMWHCIRHHCLRMDRATRDDGSVGSTADRRSSDISRTGAGETEDPTEDTTPSQPPPKVVYTHRSSEKKSKATTRWSMCHSPIVTRNFTMKHLITFQVLLWNAVIIIALCMFHMRLFYNRSRVQRARA